MFEAATDISNRLFAGSYSWLACCKQTCGKLQLSISAWALVGFLRRAAAIILDDCCWSLSFRLVSAEQSGLKRYFHRAQITT